MGIKNLNKFLRDVCPQVYKTTHISDYAYKKVAIDISIYLYKFKICFNEKWLTSMLNFVCSLRKNQLHPVFVYDGGYLPEKMNEKKERSEKKISIHTRINLLKNSLNTYYTTNTVNDVLNDYNNKIKNKRLLSTSSNIDINKIEDMLKKMTSQVNTITTSDIELTKELFSILNIPYIIAPVEAETTCSFLCNKGLVDLVMSEDSDLLAYNTPIYISNYNTSTGICLTINYEHVLQELNFNKEQFLDFCIVCGTDYNKNIPNIGIKKAYDLIKKYKKIEDIPNVDTSILNYKKVREIFTHYTKCDVKNINYCNTPDFNELGKYMKKNNIFLNVDYIRKSFLSEIVLDK
jgi:5'-3' exonuclease